MEKFLNFISKIGNGIGNVVTIIIDSSKQSLKTLLETILPFMIFISMIVGIVNYSGVGNALAELLVPVMTSIPKMILVSLICVMPFIAPLISPGAAIAQLASILIGTQISEGVIPVVYALPVLFAIDAQIGADWVPVGLSLAEAKEETVEVAVPAFLFSRMITGPLAVVIAYGVSLLAGY